jgi:hypothetical protein
MPDKAHELKHTEEETVSTERSNDTTKQPDK